MKYRRLGKTGVRLSMLGLGMAKPLTRAQLGAMIPEEITDHANAGIVKDLSTASPRLQAMVAEIEHRVGLQRQPPITDRTGSTS